MGEGAVVEPTRNYFFARGHGVPERTTPIGSDPDIVHVVSAFYLGWKQPVRRIWSDIYIPGLGQLRVIALLSLLLFFLQPASFLSPRYELDEALTQD